MQAELFAILYALATAIAERDKPITEAEAAEYLGVDSSTVARWRKAGLIESVNYPGAFVRYRPSQLDEFIERYSGKRRSLRAAS